MKKLFKRIAVLICIVTLFASPAYQVSAASNPVLTFNEDGFIVYRFQPNPLYLDWESVYEFQNLEVTGDKTWHVPAGNRFHFTFFHQEQESHVRVFVRKLTSPSHSVIVLDEIISTTFSGIDFILPPQAEDTYYMILIIPYSRINITGYSAMATNR